MGHKLESNSAEWKKCKVITSLILVRFGCNQLQKVQNWKGIYLIAKNTNYCSKKSDNFSKGFTKIARTSLILVPFGCNELQKVQNNVVTRLGQGQVKSRLGQGRPKVTSRLPQGRVKVTPRSIFREQNKMLTKPLLRQMGLEPPNPVPISQSVTTAPPSPIGNLWLYHTNNSTPFRIL